MKAAVFTKYGPPEVVQIKEVDKPTIKENQVLVRVSATAVTSGDARIRGFNIPLGFRTLSRLIFGITKPRKQVLGVVFSGIVEAIDERVTQFKVGDAVFGANNNFGTHAEYIAILERESMVLKPSNIDYTQAAAVPFGALTSLKFLRDFGKIKSGQKVLINGASGALGVYAVQLAKHFGAEVTGVCSAINLELVKSLGADHVIDYTTTDFTSNNETYDIIYDTVGKISFSHCKNSLNVNGRLLLAVAGISQYFKMLSTALIGNKKVVAGVAIFNKKDLNTIKVLLESGELKSVVGKSFLLEDIVEAHRYVDSGHKVGSAVVTLD
ncbi:NAD(P)-dependent alcohol dehydrogenase [Lacinutrix jangbogonensis]|uniref:NAD(P)-dependent alcohol dehydrogenase n=1 Tax=Lacinutrix jangbogonensis TaxID=1469557 RepID=UPI00053E6F4D|nr:NAD(P)-dependent alcohol dehydrogenase [Lacinutrix jangbogonensis]